MGASAGFLSQLVDLHPGPASPVQTNTLIAPLRLLTWPRLGNHVPQVWLHWEDTTAKKCRECGLLSEDFVFKTVSEVL